MQKVKQTFAEDSAISIEVFSGADSLLAKAFAVRRRVFVEEQHVPFELEHDEFDQNATHVLILINQQQVATGRLFADPLVSGVARLGRVAVLKEFRGRGLGARVCQTLLEIAREEGFTRVLLHAQLSVEAMYEKMGFARSGDEFEEAGISHVEMILAL